MQIVASNRAHLGFFNYHLPFLVLNGFDSGTATIRSAKRLQPVDYTCLLLACRELNNTIVPAKFENALQPVRHTALVHLTVLN